MLLSTMSLTVFAITVEEADLLYADRGTDVANAQEAAKIYEQLATESRDNYTKALMLYKESEAIYYVGTNIEGYWPIEIKGVAETPDDLKKDRKAIHDSAVEKIKNAIPLFAGMPESPEKIELLAKVTYIYGSNLGKWGENNGPLSSLAKWPELKAKMLEILKMKQAHIADFGAYRVLGRAYLKLPRIAGGSNDQSLRYLQMAYDGSLNELGECIHGLNVLYLAETLIDMKKKTEARDILQKFINSDFNTLNPSRIPETKGEQEFAKILLDRI